MRIKKLIVSGAVAIAVITGTAGTASARQGADDGAGHVRHGRGADDGAGHVRHGGRAHHGPNHR
jgi:hypothetical protein